MDTFNFSFFEDKPQEPSSAEHNGAAPEAPPTFDVSASEASDDASLDFVDFGFLDEPVEATSTEAGAASPEASSFASPARAREGHELSLESPNLEMEAHEEFRNPFDAPEEMPDIAMAPSDASEGSAFALNSDEPPSASSSESDSFSLDPNDPLAFAGFDEGSNTSTSEFSLSEPNTTPSSDSEAAPSTEESFPSETVEDAMPLVAATALAAGAVAATPQEKEPSSAPATPRAKTARFLTAEDPFGEVAPRREKLRVAILGASGIGFNHARWLAKHGGEIVGFLGSSDESVDATGERLESLLGYGPQGFSDLDQLLLKTAPQAVCVASPPALHFSQAMACLDIGAHVLCEKPLVYAPGRKPRENRDGAQELVKTAAKKKLVLATQLQYGAATPILCRLAGLSPFEVGDFAMELETTNPNAASDPKELWIDLGPHPISVAQFLGGDAAQLVTDSIQVVANQSAVGTEVSARFGVACEGGRLLMCRAIMRRLAPGSRAPRRRFSFNGRIVQYTGVKAPDRSYLAQYTAPDGYISHYPDPVDFLVGNFARTCWGDDELVLSSAQGAQNLDWLLSIGDKVAV